MTLLCIGSLINSPTVRKFVELNILAVYCFHDGYCPTTLLYYTVHTLHSCNCVHCTNSVQKGYVVQNINIVHVFSVGAHETSVGFLPLLRQHPGQDHVGHHRFDCWCYLCCPHFHNLQSQENQNGQHLLHDVPQQSEGQPVPEHGRPECHQHRQLSGDPLSHHQLRHNSQSLLPVMCLLYGSMCTSFVYSVRCLLYWDLPLTSCTPQLPRCPPTHGGQCQLSQGGPQQHHPPPSQVSWGEHRQVPVYVHSSHHLHEDSPQSDDHLHHPQCLHPLQTLPVKSMEMFDNCQSLYGGTAHTGNIMQTVSSSRLAATCGASNKLSFSENSNFNLCLFMNFVLMIQNNFV